MDNWELVEMRYNYVSAIYEKRRLIKPPYETKHLIYTNELGDVRVKKFKILLDGTTQELDKDGRVIQ